MDFPRIDSPASPEEFSWRITLQPGQELRQLDSGHAAVVYEEGLTAFGITASQARDADGTSVPTTLAVSGEDIVTLTVHHRAGDQGAGGSSFDYPITEGPPFERGYSPGEVKMPPPEPLLEKPSPEPPSTEPPLVRVPRILVRNNLGSDDLSYRPHRFYLSTDGTFGILGVHWSRYGDGTAIATGSAYANDCVPFCAAGTFQRPMAKVWLTNVVLCDGRYLYARLRYALRGFVPDNIPRSGQFSVLPRDKQGEFAC